MKWFCTTVFLIYCTEHSDSPYAFNRATVSVTTSSLIVLATYQVFFMTCVYIMCLLDPSYKYVVIKILQYSQYDKQNRSKIIIPNCTLFLLPMFLVKLFKNSQKRTNHRVSVYCMFSNYSKLCRSLSFQHLN